MCTLTVIPKDDGYLLAMNRDEQLTRGEARPPVRFDLGPTSALYPRDVLGGTWIASSSHGISLALLNRNEIALTSAAPQEKGRSRGELSPALIQRTSYSDIHDALTAFDRRGILPFRLVGILPEERTISEWTWDNVRLTSRSQHWSPRHWFSSSLSDARATTERGAVCSEAWQEADAGTRLWLRRLHASHSNGPGPFSLCVHRELVATVSFTEVVCNRNEVRMEYFAKGPCAMEQCGHAIFLEREAVAGLTPLISMR